MARISRIVQLLVSLMVVGLSWLIYPGVMALLASAAGLLYVAAAIGALRKNQLASKIASALSLATVILATLAILRFVGNGFSYITGNFELHDGIYWPPYAFLAIAIGAAVVVVLHLLSRKSITGRPNLN